METADEFLPAVYEALDASNLHFTYWEYSDAKESWNEEHLSVVDYAGAEAGAILDGLVRPFPRAVAGESPAFHYDAKTRVFSLSYTASAEGVTEISVPSRAYPAGYRVEVTQGCVDTSREGVLLVKAGAGANEIQVYPVQ
jgi:endoglycosylceramidase